MGRKGHGQLCKWPWSLCSLAIDCSVPCSDFQVFAGCPFQPAPQPGLHVGPDPGHSSDCDFTGLGMAGHSLIFNFPPSPE